MWSLCDNKWLCVWRTQYRVSRITLTLTLIHTSTINHNTQHYQHDTQHYDTTHVAIRTRPILTVNERHVTVQIDAQLAVTHEILAIDRLDDVGCGIVVVVVVVGIIVGVVGSMIGGIVSVSAVAADSAVFAAARMIVFLVGWQRVAVVVVDVVVAS
jgi:hypothetical protein